MALIAAGLEHRLCGWIMEFSALVTEASDEAIPVHAVKADDLDARARRRSTSASGASPRRRASRRRPAATSSFPTPTGISAACSSASARADAAERGPLLFGKLATALPAGHLPAGRRRRRARARGARLRARELSLRPLPQAEGGRRPPRRAARAPTAPRSPASATAIFLTRDLINTPANDLSPHDLAHAASALAARFGASISVIDGEALARGFPMIHAVGAGSDRPPCLIDIRWGIGERSEGDAGRQGHRLRHRRPRHQAGRPAWR